MRIDNMGKRKLILDPVDRVEDVKVEDNFIDDVFPMKEYRHGQKEAIKKILDSFSSGKKFVLLNAPTGSGKSVIGYTVSKILGSSFYLTSTKILQSQLVGDFDDIVDLKGRNAYKCNYWTSYLNDPSCCNTIDAITHSQSYKNCANGHCKSIGSAKCKYEGNCEYWNRLNEAIQATVCAMNYKSFLFQMMVGNRFVDRSLLIADEGHNIENELMDFVSVTFTDKMLRAANIKIEDLGSVQAYQERFRTNDISSILSELKALALSQSSIKEYEEIERLEIKLNMFMIEDPTWWVYELKNHKNGNTTLEFKPIYVRQHVNRLVFSKASSILIMSATLIDFNMIMDMYGIDRNDCVTITMPNSFPKENRPIYKKYAGSMNFKDKFGTMPELIKKVNDICRHYRDFRGIIHTHNFEIMKKLEECCSQEVSQRFLLQTNFQNKEAMLEEHAQTKNGIIVAPAMHEGLDLRDDLSRFQIICKIPYPNFMDNKQLKMRTELNHNYLGYLCALKIIQSYGRSIRSEDDWADTYVIDSEFDRFVQRNRAMLPKWFVEAITTR